MTPFAFPAFAEPTALDVRRSWTAAFDSYDQRTDDAYYAVMLHEDGRAAAAFMARVDLSWAGEDWTGPGFADRLKRDLHDVALRGETNTTYAGKMI